MYFLGKRTEFINTILFSAVFVWDENVPFRFKLRFSYKTVI